MVDTEYERVIRRGRSYLDGIREPLRSINRDLYQAERDLLDADGLPGREWFKSTMYATGVHTGFTGDAMPGVRQMVDAGDGSRAQAQVGKVAAAVDRMADRAERVAQALGGLK